MNARRTRDPFGNIIDAAWCGTILLLFAAGGARSDTANTPYMANGVTGRFATAPAANDSARVVFTVVTGQQFNDFGTVKKTNSSTFDEKRNGPKAYLAMQRLDPDFFVHTFEKE